MPQIEKCDECGREVPRASLSRRLREWGYYDGKNFLPWSSYNADYWTCDATDMGDVSMGLYADYYRPTITEGTTTPARGSQTWRGSGIYRTTVALDVSSFTHILFGIHLGARHSCAFKTFAASAGLCDSDGNNTHNLSTLTIPDQRRIWFSIATADLPSNLSASALCFYVDVSCEDAAQDWWADGAFVEDAVGPTANNPRTSGSAILHYGAGHNYVVVCLCPDCVPDELHKPSEWRGEPRFADVTEIPDEVESL